MALRLLFLTNLYPPAGNGGYEQWCQEVAEGLQRRGHQVVVLTSRVNKGREILEDPDWVHRDLFMEMDFVSLANGLQFFTQRQQREATNLAVLRRLIAVEKPDWIIIWGMWNLTRSLAALAEASLPGRVVYYLGDYWPTLPSQYEHYWQAPARSLATRLPKALLKPLAQHLLQRENRPALHFKRVLFPSRFMQQEMKRRGLHPHDSQIIAGAVDTRPYRQPVGPSEGRNRARQDGLALLYAGRLAPEKGVETAISAMDTLVNVQSVTSVTLDLAGSGEQGYVAKLRRSIQNAGLAEKVHFLGPQLKTSMPALYRQYDIFLFTSTWQEPFGRVLVEALASGLVVIGTATGGAGEILAQGEYALTFKPGDAVALAAHIRRLVEEPGLLRRLAQAGQQAAIEKFDMSRMVSEIEHYLLENGMTKPGESGEIEVAQAATGHDGLLS